MNTPLQTAAHQVIEQWDAPLWKNTISTAHFIGELRKALEAEQAQAVEPVAELPAGECYRTGNTCFQCGHDEFIATPQAAPSTSPLTGERAKLIAELRALPNEWSSGSEDVTVLCAADMLETDAREIEATTRQVEILSDELSKCSKAQQPLSLDLLKRLSKTLTKLGYSTPEGGMEHFGARIESQLYNLCRGVDSLLAQQGKKLDHKPDWSAA